MSPNFSTITVPGVPNEGVPVILAPAGGSVWLKNLDLNNAIYLYGTSSVDPATPNYNAPLNPGEGQGFDGTEDIYATCLSGQSAKLGLYPSGIGATPSAQEIATSLTDSGLAQAIASAIQITGVPPIDIPTPVYIVFQQNVAAGGTFTSPEIDASAYQSFVGTMFSAATSAGTGTNPFTKMHIAWGLAVDNYDPLHVEDWVVPNTPYNFTYVYRNDLQGPCYGDHFALTFTNYDTEPCLITIGIFGSYRSRIRTAIRGRYAWNSDGSPNDSIGLGSDSIISSYNTGTIAAGTTSTPALMNLFSGPAIVAGSVSGTNPVWEVEIEPQPTSVLSSNINLVGSGEQLSPEEIMLPRRVCTIAVHNAGASNPITSAQIVVIGQEQPE